jgi:hypothetical protein
MPRVVAKCWAKFRSHGHILWLDSLRAACHSPSDAAFTAARLPISTFESTFSQIRIVVNSGLGVTSDHCHETFRYAHPLVARSLLLPASVTHCGPGEERQER